MKMKLYVSILCLAMVIEIVTANVRLQRSPQKYCGSKLADMLRILCKTKYNERKRSIMDSENMDYRPLEAYDAMGFPYRSMDKAMGFVPSRSVRSPSPRQKITDECCRKPCDISQLRTYCAI